MLPKFYTKLFFFNALVVVTTFNVFTAKAVYENYHFAGTTDSWRFIFSLIAFLIFFGMLLALVLVKKYYK